VLLLVASSHGVHGLVVIADDYITGAGGRKVIRLLSILMLVSVGAIGLYVIWTS
jgi:succinate dehydrogenase hydrophobic anchor subunit